MPRLVMIAVVALLQIGSLAQTALPPFPADRVLTHREQAAHVARWIRDRFDTVLPALMRRERIDMWIIVSREYNDDPVFRSMAPLTTFSSRRRTILVFHNPGGGKPVERLSIGRFDYDGLYTVVQTHNDAQYEGLRKVVEERDPKVIGINESDAWNHADGLTANEKRRLMAAGTSFRTLCEDARRDLAGHYLSEGEMSLGEIAFRLGFDDANSFFRAFRRWTGMTPGDYRRHATPAPQQPA